jgi:hypothetical protein
MKTTQILSIIATSCLLMFNDASADIFNVPATANIFSAGLSTPVAPSGGGAGILPVQITLNPGLGTFQFQVSGNVSPNDGQFSLGGDGTHGMNSNIDPCGGISGFLCVRGFPLVGVFLTAATPQAPPPPTLNFTSAGLGIDFLSLSPQIGQLFFIGDGLTGTDSGQTQTFYAPAGATRLYLGFADAVWEQGAPGQYSDNVGSLNVSVTAVPEPTSVALILAGSVLMATVRCRNKR